MARLVIELRRSTMRPSSLRLAATATGTSTRSLSPSSVIKVSSIPRRGVRIRSAGPHNSAALGQLRIGTRHEPFERAMSPDPVTDEVLALWLAGE